MIDILFVHTNSSTQTFQSLLKYAAIEPPIWAALLANSMRSLGVRVDILDCEALQLDTEQSYNHIKDINPSLVCFVQFGQHPSASAQNMQGTHELLEMMDYEFKTILVGLYPSALPEKTLKDEKCDFEIGALEELVKNKEVMVYKHNGNWECMDHERDVEHLNSLWNNNKAFWKKWD